MIIGIGNDLVDIRRIEKTLKTHKERFITRCFSKSEQEQLAQRKEDQRASFLAKRFAAKEACVKALGSGFVGDIYLKDISVERDDLGKPSLVLTGGALERLIELSPNNLKPHLHLSLSDEPPYASAFVILEAR
ncbi:MAG: holo-ACP synthase [Alphaproteobacteria bacterium]